LDQFAQWIAPQWQPESLVDETDELLPRWLSLITLEEGEPLRGVTGHMKCRQKHLPGILSLLDAKKLTASVEPWEWVFSVVVCEKQQLVSMLGGVGDGIGIVWGVVFPWQEALANESPSPILLD
jgi:hypothetical protein